MEGLCIVCGGEQRGSAVTWETGEMSWNYWLFIKLVACAYMHSHTVWSSKHLPTFWTHYYQYYRWM